MERISGQQITTMTHRSTNTYRLEGKRREDKTIQKHNQAQHFIKVKYSQEVQSSLTDSQAKYERVCYIKSKERKLQEEAKSTLPQQ
jgi:hypothetical protein